MPKFILRLNILPIALLTFVYMREVNNTGKLSNYQKAPKDVFEGQHVTG